MCETVVSLFDVQEQDHSAASSVCHFEAVHYSLH